MGKCFRRIVVKVGSSVVCSEEGIDEQALRSICRDVASFKRDALIVSSGAIAFGKLKLGISGELSLKLQQACASVGQIELAKHYADILASFGRVAAQLLLTEKDFLDAESRENLFRCVEALLERSVVPIINENDAVSVAELTYRQGVFGDNDVLSAIIAKNLKADLLIILSNVDGIFDSNGELIRHLSKDGGDVVHFNVPSLGRGGISTKLEAARMCASAGIPVIIANGKKEHIVRDVLEGKGSWTLVC